jgi:hypothetical protein
VQDQQGNMVTSRNPVRGPGSNQHGDKPPLPPSEEDVAAIRSRSQSARESLGGLNESPNETTTEATLQRFLVSREANRRWQRWRQDRSRAGVVAAVEGHTSAVVYDLTPTDIEDVCKRTTHALGGVRKADINPVTEIRDWNPPFAFTHVFHLATETLGEVPTFDGVRDFCRNDPVVRENLWDPALRIVQEASANHDPRLAKAAMTWRIGNAYYSYLRETYVLASLRQMGVPVQVHPLADALFRTDFWVNNTNIDLYISNPRYKTQWGGRKSKSEAILRDATPTFDFAVIELQTRHEFGTVHLPDQRSIEKIIPNLGL